MPIVRKVGIKTIIEHIPHKLDRTPEIKIKEIENIDN